MAQQSNIFPFEIRDIRLDLEANDTFVEDFEDNYVQVGPKSYYLRIAYRDHAATIYNLEPRADQVFVGGYPRSVMYCPYFEHIKEAWEKRSHPNLLFLFYEDIQKDQLNTLRRVADFFDKSYTDEQLMGLGSYLHFDNLKDKKTFNRSMLKDIGVFKPDAEPLVRKGKIGGWRDHFDEEMTCEAEQWIADNLRDTDLRFPTFTVE